MHSEYDGSGGEEVRPRLHRTFELHDGCIGEGNACVRIVVWIQGAARMTMTRPGASKRCVANVAGDHLCVHRKPIENRS